MIKRLTIGSLRMTFSCARITKVIGVNSELKDKNHIIMWDFDEVPLDKVIESLKQVQTRYFLSDIYILETKKEKNYCAYCFTAVPLRRAIEIVAATKDVDWNYLRYSVWRWHFTLRTTPKGNRDSHLVARLEGYELPTAKVEDLYYWTEYETLDD